MYRHVSTFHLDLAQLWQCPVSWCTKWKGTPQDCMDHVWGGGHNVPWDVKSASLEKFVPPWTVRRQGCVYSLAINHSGISMDALLFSEVHLSLTHHYLVHKFGLPHMAFRKDYLARLSSLVSPVASQSPSASGASRPSRSDRRRMRPVRILEESFGDLQALTAQNPVDLQGAVIYDCRPPLLPISLRLKDIGRLPLHRTIPSASLAAPPREDSMDIGGVSPNELVVPELGVAPLSDSDTCVSSSGGSGRPALGCIPVVLGLTDWLCL